MHRQSESKSYPISISWDRRPWFLLPVFQVKISVFGNDFQDAFCAFCDSFFLANNQWDHFCMDRKKPKKTNCLHVFFNEDFGIQNKIDMIFIINILNYCAEKSGFSKTIHAILMHSSWVFFPFAREKNRSKTPNHPTRHGDRWFGPVRTVRPSFSGSKSHRIHVWYTYLPLPLFSIKIHPNVR